MLLPIQDFLQDKDIKFSQIRSSGAGGQHVNKVSTGIVLRFDIKASSLPQKWKEKLLQHRSKHLNSSGEVVIKVTKHRSQVRNRREAKERLVSIINASLVAPKKRKRTKPPTSASRLRLEAKSRRSHLKASRRKPSDLE